MRTLLAVAREVLEDLVRLNLPVTATAIVAAVVGALQPLGVDLGDQAAWMAGALALLGVTIAYAQGLARRVREQRAPADPGPAVDPD